MGISISTRVPLSNTELEAFNQAWTQCAVDGQCDALGGMEYARVLIAWVKCCKPIDLRAFIRCMANLQPDDDFDNFPP